MWTAAWTQIVCYTSSLFVIQLDERFLWGKVPQSWISCFLRSPPQRNSPWELRFAFRSRCRTSRGLAGLGAWERSVACWFLMEKLQQRAGRCLFSWSRGIGWALCLWLSSHSYTIVQLPLRYLLAIHLLLPRYWANELTYPQSDSFQIAWCKQLLRLGFLLSFWF